MSAPIASPATPPSPTSLNPTAVEPSAARSYSTAWWGMLMLILTEAMVFAALLSAYLFLRAAAPVWPLGGIEAPELRLSLIFSFVLWGSSLPLFWAEASIRKGRVGPLKAGLAVSWLMGAAFLAYTLWDFNDLHFGWRDNAYASLRYTIVGLHGIHVLVGLSMSLAVQAKAWMGKVDGEHHDSAEVFFLYWHFVDLVWVAVFATLFVSEHLG